MWLFFRDDGFGVGAKAFSRLVTTFARHDQRLNAAAIPSLLTDEILKESIPYSYQASPYLQIVNYGETLQANHSLDLSKQRDWLLQVRSDFETRLENYFPCFVPASQAKREFLGLLPECGFKMISRDERSQSTPVLVPDFSVSFELNPQKSAKEIFKDLARFHDEGRDFAGVRLNHSDMQEEDFVKLDELLNELTKRNIQTVFFSDMFPGSERRIGIEMGHV